jgi:polysaccharide export outer membrane protein
MLIVLLGGCAQPRVQPGAVPSEAAGSPGALALGLDTPETFGAYRLGPSDVISVTVYREPEVSLQSVTLDTAGQFQMPLVGRVDAAGKTPDELSRFLAERLRSGFIRNPNVAVNIVNATSRRFVVEGAVVNPGIFPFTPDTTLLAAVAAAKGPTRVARLNQVAVFRSRGAERSVAVFDLKAIRAGQAADPRLQAGDKIVVGFSGLTQAWQDFLQAAPLIGIFSRF